MSEFGEEHDPLAGLDFDYTKQDAVRDAAEDGEPNIVLRGAFARIENMMASRQPTDSPEGEELIRPQVDMSPERKEALTQAFQPFIERATRRIARKLAEDRANNEDGDPPHFGW